jgi:tetratricopeptide (TPR) repeat protein
MAEQTQEIQELITKGHSAAWDQMWEDASSYYQQALELDADNLKALSSLGLAYYEMRSFDSALETYRRVVELNKEDPAPYEKMYLIYTQLGDNESAIKVALRAAEAHLKNEDIQKSIENWQRVIELDTLNAKARARLAMVYEKMGRKKLAISEYINVASILQKSGNQKKAQEAVERAIKTSPENIIALRAKEILHQGRQLPLPEPKEKEPEFEPDLDVLQLDAPEPEAERASVSPVEEAREKSMEVLAEALFKEDISPARKGPEDRDLDSMLSWNDQGEDEAGEESYLKLYLSHAIEHMSNGDQKAASESIKSAVDAGFTDPAAFFLLGYLYLETGRLESAARNLNKAVSRSGFALASRILLARYYRGQEQWKEASTEYIEALRIADTSLVSREEVDDLIHLYEAMVDDLESQDGEEAFIQTCDHIEGLLNRPDWRNVLREMRGTGDLDAGQLLPSLDGMLEDRRSQVMTIHKSIQSLLDDGRYGAAMEIAFFALQNAPTFLPMHITVGDILLKQGKQTGAVTKYLAVADVYTVQGKIERALAMLQKVVELEPMNVEVRRRHIDLLEQYGKTETAIVEYNNLADVYWTLAELDSAREAYQQSLELATTLTDRGEWKLKVLHNLADIDVQRLDWDAALQTYLTITTDFPKNQKASTSVVDMYLRLGQTNKAEKEIQRFVEQFDIVNESEMILEYLTHLKKEKPGETVVTRQLASLYHRAGETDKAIAELDKFGDTLLDEGRVEDVILVIEDIISFNPPNIEDYRKLLEQLKG